MAGVRADAPETGAATESPSQPATTQASQPATAPAVTREQIMPILKQLDSEAFKDRQDAQEKLQGLGLGALPPLREILKSEKLSLEVVSRVKTAMMSIKATTRPALLNPQPAGPQEIFVRRGMRADVPAQPAENPED
jgi:hypothetical protein